MSLFDATKRIYDIHRSNKNYNEEPLTADELNILEKGFKDPIDEEFEKFFKRNYNNLNAGDIIFTPKSLGNHYGVYIGDDLVIHTTDNNSFEEVNIKVFSNEYNDLYVIDFNKIRKLLLDNELLKNYLESVGQVEYLDTFVTTFKEFTPQQTADRAKDLLENNDKITFDNQYQFTLWCKTNISDFKEEFLTPFKIKYKK